MSRARERPVDRLGAGALAHYRENGWQVTEHGQLDTGMRTGPCARCTAITVVYGPNGQPLCPQCRGADGAPDTEGGRDQ